MSASSARRRPSATAVAGKLAVWVLGAPVALLVFVMILIALVTGDTSPTTTIAPFAGVLSITVGMVLVTRLPTNRIGWLLWLGGMLIAITRITQGFADHGLTSDPGSVPGAIWFAWVNAWVGLPSVVTLPVFLPLLYPTGRLPSPRWRGVAILAILGVVAGSLVDALSPFPAGNYPPGVANPLAVGGAWADTLATLGNLVSLVLLLALVLGLGSLVLRYRRAIGIERQQFKWFAFVGSIAVVAFIVAAGDLGSTSGPLATLDNLAWLAGFGALALLPVAIGVAVLRYRLYEIDRLVSRSISWAVLSAIVGGLFVALILALQAVLAPVTGSNQLAVAGSTILVATTFGQIRGRVQRLVDRRFNRSRYDAERTIAGFARILRDEIDMRALHAEILATVTTAVEPTSVSLWLRG
jgi:hypothetical protein